MSTTVYGCSDDLVEFEGDVTGEVGSFDEGPVSLRFSDGTRLTIEYAPEGEPLAVWRIVVEKRGPLFVNVDPCEDDSNKIYSDVAYFVSGLEWCEWRVKGRRWARVD